jgi:hypothetical protein
VIESQAEHVEPPSTITVPQFEQNMPTSIAQLRQCPQADTGTKPHLTDVCLSRHDSPPGLAVEGVGLPLLEGCRDRNSTGMPGLLASQES